MKLPKLSLPWRRASKAADAPDVELEAAGRSRHWRLPQSGHRLLALQVGNFGLQIALVQSDKTQSQMLALAHSHSADFSRAIAEALEELRKHSRRLPRRAILLTPSLVQDLLHLPVSPLRPRSADQMRELIHWELEKSTALWRSQWRLGSILIGQGYLTLEQRANLLAQQKLLSSEGQTPVRLGELALEHAYLDQEQLEECLTLQAKLAAQDDELQYSWQPAEPPRSGPSDESLLSQEEDHDSRHPWLVSGISRSVFQRWIGACNLNGLRLEAFYPGAGSSFPCLPDMPPQEPRQLLEVHPEHVVMLTGEQTVVQSIQVLAREDGALAERCRHLLALYADPASTVYVNVQTRLDDPDALLQALGQGADFTLQALELEGLPQDLEGTPPLGRLTSLAGAVRRHLRQVPPGWLNGLEAVEQKKSRLEALRQPKVLLVGGVLLVLVLMLASMAYMWWNTGVQRQRLLDLDARYDQESKLKQQYQQIQAANQRLKEQVLALRSETNSARQILLRSSLDSSFRRVALPLLLQAILNSVSEGVRLLEIRKEGDLLALRLEATSSAEGQEYVARLAKQVRPLGYQAANSSAGNAENGLPLVSFELHFKPELLLEQMSTAVNPSGVAAP